MKRCIVGGLSLIGVWACSEANENERRPDAANLPTTATKLDASTGSDPSPDTSGDAGAGAVVINEISARGAEWIELYNAGSVDVDLSGYFVADSIKGDGGPKWKEATELPQGTILAPESYLLVVSVEADAGLVCPNGGEGPCVGAEWGISNTEGDAFFLGDGNKVVKTHATYPPNATASGQTWGRSPNGTGEFRVNKPSPGSANQVP